MKELLPLIISLGITLIFLNIIKLGLIPGFIVGTVLWSVLHFNLSKIFKGKK